MESVNGKLSRYCNKIAEATGLEVVILRSPLVYGPRVKANFLRLLKVVTWHSTPLSNVNNQTQFDLFRKIWLMPFSPAFRIQKQPDRPIW